MRSRLLVPLPSLALLFALLAAPPARAEPPAAADSATADPAAPPESADAVVARVLAANPQLAAAQARVEALTQTARKAGVWKDPMAAVEYSNMPWSTPYPGNHPMSGVQLRVEQTFPWPGKTAAREAAAEAHIDVARAGLEATRNRLAGLARDLYHRLALTRQLREVTREHVELVGQFRQAVRSAYEVGRAAQHDLLRLDVLHGQLQDQLGDFDRDEGQLLASLNGAMHRAVDAPVTTPEAIDLRVPETTQDALLEAAIASRPDLARLRAEVQAQQLAAEAADAERAPDVTAWAGYRVRTPVGTDEGEDFIMAGVAIPLPWFWNDRRWGAEAQARRAEARVAQAELQAEIDDLAASIESQLARWRRADEKARRYVDELVPAAQRTLDATFSAYRVGRADFASLFQAELQLLDFQRAIRTARAEAARAAAAVDTLVGRAPTLSNGSQGS